MGARCLKTHTILSSITLCLQLSNRFTLGFLESCARHLVSLDGSLVEDADFSAMRMCKQVSDYLFTRAYVFDAAECSSCTKEVIVMRSCFVKQIPANPA